MGAGGNGCVFSPFFPATADIATEMKQAHEDAMTQMPVHTDLLNEFCATPLSSRWVSKLLPAHRATQEFQRSLLFIRDDPYQNGGLYPVIQPLPAVYDAGVAAGGATELEQCRVTTVRDAFAANSAMQLVYQRAGGGILIDHVNSRRVETGRQSLGPAFITRFLYECRSLVFALVHYHSNALVHRDIKFDNIALMKDLAQLRFIDFGSAQSLTDDALLMRMPERVGTRGYSSIASVRLLMIANRTQPNHADVFHENALFVQRTSANARNYFPAWFSNPTALKLVAYIATNNIGVFALSRDAENEPFVVRLRQELAKQGRECTTTHMLAAAAAVHNDIYSLTTVIAFIYHCLTGVQVSLCFQGLLDARESMIAATKKVERVVLSVPAMVTFPDPTSTAPGGRHYAPGLDLDAAHAMMARFIADAHLGTLWPSQMNQRFGDILHALKSVTHAPAPVPPSVPPFVPPSARAPPTSDAACSTEVSCGSKRKRQR